MTEGLNRNHKQLLLKQLDETVIRLEGELREVREIREVLKRELGQESYNESSTTTKRKIPRLGPGVPKKWVTEALKSDESFSISMIMDYTEEHKGRRLRDAPIRRALMQLQEEGKAKRNDDGSWSWGKKMIDLKGEVVNDKDDLLS